MSHASRKVALGITQLLENYQAGDPKALDELIPLVYEQVKKIARNQMRAQSASHTLTPTALVHEVFLKLKQSGELSAGNRTHFYAIAAQSMRWLLADFARAKNREKRGQGPVKVSFEENAHSPREGGADVSLLHEALEQLNRQDARLARIVELRYLVGLTIEETAEALQVSPMTVKRDWLTAKAWLARAMTSED